MSWGEPADEFCLAIIDCLDRHRHAFFVLADSGGHIIGCNQAMARLLGLSSDELKDQSIWDKLTESDGARLMERLRQAECGADPLLLNFVARNHTPSTLDCSVVLTRRGHFLILGVPARSSSEDSELAWLELNNAFATVSRESARKSKQLEFKNAELVSTAEELKRANEALTQARNAALSAAQAKSDFLSHMSHEIRTPMNGVLGMVQLLLATELTAEQRRFVEVAQSSGRALLALINDILDLSKIEAGKVVLESLDFDLSRTLDDVIEILRVQADAKGLALHLRVTRETPTLVRGDPNRLRQVLTNLCANAIKFTERGEVALNVELVREDDGKATIRFAVVDTGIGIRPDQAQTLFSPFVQADASTTRKYGGTGLGLAISKQLVEMMGGHIGIDSTEGEGSSFWFTVVFEIRPEVVFERIDKQAVVPNEAAARKHEARILIAEDNPTNQFVGLAQLAKLGYKADAVANGAEAIEALRSSSYDLVLMDCEMPTMDGYEATRRIRATGNRSLPIIALTANAMSGDRERCISEGMNDFLSKPVELDRLEEVLTKWLDRPDP